MSAVTALGMATRCPISTSRTATSRTVSTKTATSRTASSRTVEDGGPSGVVVGGGCRLGSVEMKRHCSHYYGVQQAVQQASSASKHSAQSTYGDMVVHDSV